MSISDFLIIYFACGAPVGVYFYFQHRRLYSKQLWLKTILNFGFWIPYLVQIILKSRIINNFSKSGLKTKNNLAADKNKHLAAVQKEIEKILSVNDIDVSIYEFREVTERFAGLTLACAQNKTEPFKHEKEIYRIAGAKAQELSAQCLHRRNQKQLYFHQTQAENDFLQMIAVVSDFVREQTELKYLTLEFTELLDNFRAQRALAEFFETKLQRSVETPVKDLERNLWKPEPRKPSTVNPISTSLQAINEKAKSFAKD